MPDIKNTFIQRSLQEYLRAVENAMRAAAQKTKMNVTGEGIASISHKVLQAGGGALGELSFNEYLRFVDMGVGRAHPLGGLKATEVALQSSKKTGFALEKDKTRKPKKIYSKPAYGLLGSLYGKLSYGYTEEVIAALKQELQETTNQNS